MKIKSIAITVTTLLSLVLLVLWGNQFYNVNTVLNSQGNCQLINNQCAFSLDQQRLSIKFEQSPIPEEELFVQFEHSENIQIHKVYVEGVNMYMGKTPVIFEDANSLRGVFFLGSCNLPEMQWQMVIEVSREGQTNTNQHLIVNFSTVQ
ncbi:hypothetical protein [Glaciecola sp. 1036]|uniref:hypothetical protein n=1 Tax=Alteromonadaceae TaxID=72275 RepID=UPI003D094C71